MLLAKPCTYAKKSHQIQSNADRKQIGGLIDEAHMLIPVKI